LFFSKKHSRGNTAMRIATLVCMGIVAFYNSGAFAAQINLAGVVTDTLGNPISGAIVFAKTINKIDTTDANGRFAIQDPPVAILQAKNSVEPFFDVTVTHDEIRVFVPEKQLLSIRVFDVSGRNLGAIGNHVFNQGWQTVKPDNPLPSGRVLVVRVNGRNGLQSTRVFYGVGSGSVASKVDYRLSTTDLAKRFAAVDTLFINCKDFRRAVKPISNLIEADTIKMKNWPSGSRVLGMKYLPSDTFTMGQAGLYNTVDGHVLGDAFPVHKVALSAFYVDSTEVTQADYENIMKVDPTYNAGHPAYAVDGTTWYDAVLYCNARGKKEGLDTVYTYTAVTGTTPGKATSNLANCSIHYDKPGYRLPTEAEWEYACRGGTRTNVYWGTAPDSLYEWASNNAGGHTNTVAKKLPNAYKLFDMAGNVWEWTSTFTVQYTSDAQTDPLGPVTGTNGVQLRGAAWHEGYGDAQFYSACRHSERGLGNSYNNVGFRVLLSEH
jgi:formylglycine-generating enzyme required for sulfatase activity